MSGRSVVVTGAGKGIGAAVAARLATDGWRVVGVDLDAEALGRAAELAAAVVGDVGEPEVLAQAALAAEAEAPLYGWVNNAGVMGEQRLDQLTPERTAATLRTNLLATIEGCRLAVTAFMREGREGAIVNVSSIHARAGFPGTPVYDATKGAIEALTRQLCAEYGHLGIRVNAVAPGAVLTAMTRRTLEQSDDGEALLAQWASFAPMGRVLAPEDVADPIAFLLSPDARAVNGHVLAVDGGMATRAFAFPPDPDISPEDHR